MENGHRPSENGKSAVHHDDSSESSLLKEKETEDDLPVNLEV